MSEVKHFTPERIYEALRDLTDGISAEDLAGVTGLPIERCQEIIELGAYAAKVISPAGF